MKIAPTTAFNGLLFLTLLQACSDDDAGASVRNERDAGRTTSGDKSSAINEDASGLTETETESAVTDAGSSSDTGTARPDVSTDASWNDSALQPDADRDVAMDAAMPYVEADDALYALSAQVYDGNTWLSYLITTPRLDAQLGLDEATEIAGRALAVGPTNAAVTYVTTGTSITRYVLDGSDKLVAEQPTISFSGVGVTDIHEYGGQFVFVSPTKAYFFDGDNSQVVLWNPQSMTVGQPISLDVLSEDSEGLTITFSAAPIRIEERVFTFVGLRQGVVPVAPTAVVALDTKNDSANVVTDDRCGYVRDGVLAADGWIYLATEAYAAAYHRINASGDIASPCLLRFDPQAQEFDPDFHVELSSMVNGGVAGTLVVASNGSAYLKVLDEELAPISLDSNARVVASQPAWHWGKLSPGAEPAVTMLDLPATSGSITPIDLGDRRVALSNRQAEVNGTMITVSDISNLQSEPSPVIGGVDGLVFSITKLR
jgi:hypothetical protein